MLNLSVAELDAQSTFSVAEGTSRTLTFQASSLGVSLLSTYNLNIYQLNPDSGNYERIDVVNNWLQVGLVAGTSGQLTLTLPEGDYVFLLNAANGVSVLTGFTLNVLQDTTHGYVTTGSSVTGNVIDGDSEGAGGDTAPAGTLVSEVDGTGINASGVTNITGQYGTLTIDALGNYTYTLNAGLAAGSITGDETFTYELKTPNGSTSTATLTIDLQPGTLQAVDDSVDLATSATVVQEVENFANIASASWTTVVGTNSATGSGGFTVEADSVLHNITLGFTVTGVALTGTNITWAIVNSSGTSVRTGSVAPSGIIGGAATVNVSGLDLEAGNYTLRVTGSSSVLGLTTVRGSVRGTETHVDEFHTGASATVTGNILDGSGADGVADSLISVGTRIAISNANDSDSAALNPYDRNATSATVDGLYGTLTINADGSYSYVRDANIDLSTMTQKEVFDYTLTATDGSTSSASLTIDLNMQITGSNYADTVNSTPNDDTFTLGGGGDTVVYNLLDNADATGGNGTDTWTDFSLAQDDQIDIGELLIGLNGAGGTIGNFVSVEFDGENTIVSIDRDGQGTNFESTQLITLEGVNVSLEELLQHLNTDV
ncbi:beta strand repeat-containing protein [Winslowiella toletana]|uniref:beta strand repeat-containing protein n=1 Tax=Winslowiella toletana TaxID=92490 RepID=UPI0028BD9A18|nr:type I secretion C-terminal target domain-containing protein [Winslowiella toletana]WNN43796.1 type I secretion C-terminal target domain-containing protein [Winslowiella toletana]